MKVLVWRIFFAAILVFGTWNPTGWSYIDWVRHSLAIGVSDPYKVGLAVLGFLVLFGWAGCLYAARRKLRRGAYIWGFVIVALVYGGIVFFLDPTLGSALHALIWAVLACVSIFLGLAITHDEYRNFSRRNAPPPRYRGRRYR